MSDHSDRIEFWEERYSTERTPWDLQDSPAALRNFLLGARPGGRVLIPGCGYGHEVGQFHAAGWKAEAVDFSPTAVARARAALGPLGVLVREADFFSTDFGAPFDLVYERTFLCALPVERWPAYAERIHRLLRPGGVLAGVFYHGVDPDGPPFPIDAGVAKELFRDFELVTDRPIPPGESLPLHAGFERWQEWRRRG